MILAYHVKATDNDELVAKQTFDLQRGFVELMITSYDQELVPSFWLTIDSTAHKRFDNILSTWIECYATVKERIAREETGIIRVKDGDNGLDLYAISIRESVDSAIEKIGSPNRGSLWDRVQRFNNYFCDREQTEEDSLYFLERRYRVLEFEPNPASASKRNQGVPSYCWIYNIPGYPKALSVPHRDSFSLKSRFHNWLSNLST